VEDWASEFVGIGDYPNNNQAFPKSIMYTFDSIAVDAGVRCIIYNGANFTGDVVFDETGPFVMWNTLYAPGGIYYKYVQPGGPTLEWESWQDGNEDPQQTGVTYEEIFPPELRIYSESDMYGWVGGSLKLRQVS